jgi:hypothetical protein
VAVAPAARSRGQRTGRDVLPRSNRQAAATFGGHRAAPSGAHILRDLARAWAEVQGRARPGEPQAQAQADYDQMSRAEVAVQAPATPAAMTVRGAFAAAETALAVAEAEVARPVPDPAQTDPAHTDPAQTEPILAASAQAEAELAKPGPEATPPEDGPVAAGAEPELAKREPVLLGADLVVSGSEPVPVRPVLAVPVTDEADASVLAEAVVDAPVADEVVLGQRGAPAIPGPPPEQQVGLLAAAAPALPTALTGMA